MPTLHNLAWCNHPEVAAAIKLERIIMRKEETQVLSERYSLWSTLLKMTAALIIKFPCGSSLVLDSFHASLSTFVHKSDDTIPTTTHLSPRSRLHVNFAFRFLVVLRSLAVMTNLSGGLPTFACRRAATHALPVYLPLVKLSAHLRRGS